MKGVAVATLAAFEQGIKEEIGKPRFDLWFSDKTRLRLEDGALEIGVPNRFYREWLESHFQQEIRLVSERVFGESLAIRFRIDPTLFRQSQEENRRHIAEEMVVPNPIGVTPVSLPAKQTRPTRFDLVRFLPGTSNRVAFSAVTTLLESPRGGHSPLFLFGGTGLGKSHLLKGIEIGLRRRYQDLKIEHFASEAFTNEFLDSMRTNKLANFRRRIRQADILLVDDVQFLAGKRATQEEFLHTLNAFESRGGRVVLAGDVHPRKLVKFSEELRARFVSGMVARIDPPNRDLRKQILRVRAAERHMELTPAVLDLLADSLTSHVGELEGAVNYLEHYSDTLASKLDLLTVKSALAEILRHSAPVVRVPHVLKKGCEVFGISLRALREKKRLRTISHPRMLLAYLCRKHTSATYSEIGEQIGGLNHSTVIAAEKKIQLQIEQDGEMMINQRPWKVRDAIEAFERALGRA